MSIKKTLTILFFGTVIAFVYGQQKTYQSATIGFYNLENLFDTVQSAGYINGYLDYTDPNYHTSIPFDSIANYDVEPFKMRYTYNNLKNKKVIRPLILIDEFTPTGAKRWNTQKYNQKLKNLAKVIRNMGKDITKNAPVILGFAEVENRQVVEDLANHSTLKKYDYGVVHFNSFDKRGIDCALIYQKKRFKVTEAIPYVLEVYNDNGNRDYTRDILRVTGLLDGDEVHVLVNHWPSRRGGEKASNHKRVAAGKLLRSICDEILLQDPNAKIIALGDFNDDPTNQSIYSELHAKGNAKRLKERELYNPMYKMFKKGFGTLAFRDGWNLFDQVILSPGLLGRDYTSYKTFKTEIFSPSYLLTPEGQYKGYPYRMYGWDNYRPDGYSDHFPVYTVLIRELP